MSMVKYFLGFGVCMLLSGLVLAIEPMAEKEIRTVLSAQMDLAHQTCATPPDAESLQKKYGAALSPYLKEYTTHLGDLVAQIDIKRLCTKYGAAILPYIEQYTTDPNSRVRLEAYALMVGIGRDANDTPDRQAIVYKLLTRLRQDEEHKQYLGRRLLQFRAGDFSTESKQILNELLTTALGKGKLNGYVRGYVMLLVGVADMKSELPRLKEFMEQQEDKRKQEHQKEVDSLRERLARHQKRVDRLRELNSRIPEGDKYRLKILNKQLKKQYWQSSLMWVALRARARMGVKEDIHRCIELVESHPDEEYRRDRLLQALAYVRQPEIVGYLYDYLQHSKAKTEFRGDAIIYSEAQRAAMALAAMLRGFPGKKHYGGDQETMERCRRWMSEQKQWDIIR